MQLEFEEKDRLQQERFAASEIKTVLLVSSCFSSKEKETALEHLDELQDLAETAGFVVKEKVVCVCKSIQIRTYIGKGKVQEIQETAEQKDIDAIIFDDEISPNQQKNLEFAIKKPILDRRELILEVFAAQAKTKEAALQIELAKLHYQLPRLKRMWTHLSRQKTGAGGTSAFRGVGEKQIELDRRMVKRRIATLEKELKAVQHHRDLQRKARLQNPDPIFAIVGYTNVGKSTLLNAWTDAGTLVEDKLFATLDTKTKKYILPNNQSILLIDTVGFIRKLPHALVEAFKSTLEEVCYADIFLHIIDISHPQAFERAEETLKVLKELGAEHTPTITVLNKIDQVDRPDALIHFKTNYPNVVPISAKWAIGFPDLFAKMVEEISHLRDHVKLRVPQSRHDIINLLYKDGKICSLDYENNDILLEVEISKRFYHIIANYII